MRSRGVLALTEWHGSQEEEELAKAEEGEFWGSVGGVPLKADWVKQTRQDELREFAKLQVYTKVPISECWEKTGKKPIGVTWVDINKGDEANSEYRSRLVAKEIKRDNREVFFLQPHRKVLLSLAMTEGVGYKRGKEEEGMKSEFINT